MKEQCSYREYMMARKNPEVTKRIRARIDKWDKYWRINREQWYEWVQFVMGDQWREDESKLFERYNKIPLTFNKLGALANHMLGDQRQNTPMLQIHPDDFVPPQTADTRAALIKNISFNSPSEIAYQTAFQGSIVGGYGAFGGQIKYSDENSFEQEFEIFEIKDPNRCYWDVAAETPCKTDGMGCGYRIRMSREKFKGIYGENIESKIGSTAITEDSSLAFADDDSITIVYDFEREGKKSTIYKLSNGQTVSKKELKALETFEIDGMETALYIYQGEPVSVVDERDVTRYTIKHREIAGEYILNETDFPTQQLPIVYVDQNSYWDKRGQQITRSFFQDVKDAQRYLNYLATQSAYIMKVSRYDQFMASRKNVAAPDTQQIWRDPSVQQGALIYDESPNGNKPEQLRPPELSQSLMTQYERCLMDIQTGTGMYNTQLGEKGNEVSGRAIDARTKRGSYNTYVPFNSLNRAIACMGQIINEAIPSVYSDERLIMLQMPDRENVPTKLNEPVDEYGMEVTNDMTTGNYHIRLLPGASYEGQKMEALQSMEMMLAADKSGQVFPLIADLYAENLPLPNSNELRNRLRTIVPPEIIEAGKTGKPLPPKPPQPNPEMEMIALKKQELEAKIADGQREMQQKAKEFELKEKEMQRKAIETHQDMTVAWAKLESEKEEAAAQLQEAILRYKAELQNIQNNAEMTHANNLVKLLTHGTQLHHEREMQHKELNHPSNNQLKQPKSE
jgi:hypothetical protein